MCFIFVGLITKQSYIGGVESRIMGGVIPKIYYE